MDDSGSAVVEARDAGTLVLLRGSGKAREVLMGVRGSGARCMPGRWVFPGGALDAADRPGPFFPMAVTREPSGRFDPGTGN